MLILYFLVLTIPSIIRYINDFINGNIKGPIPLPILGNIIILINSFDDRIEFLKSLFKKYGNTCCVYFPSLLGMKRWIFINDSESVKYILKDNFNNYPKGDEFHEIFEELLGDGIFNVDGCIWSSQRKISSYKFNVNTLRDYMTDIFIKKTNTTLDLIESQFNLSEYKNNCINIKPYFYDYTLLSIFEIGFGVDLDSVQNNRLFSICFDLVQPLFEYRFINPFWKLQRLMNSGNELKIKMYMKIINKQIYNIIKKRELNSKGNDILSQFTMNKHLNDKQLRDILINFLIAGRDTTAALITRSYYMLLKYPKYQKKILDEFNAYDNFDYNTITKLKYMKAFLYEVLRMYPPVSKNSKTAVNDDILPNGKKIQAGDRIVYSSQLLGLSEENYKNAGEFNPQRWLDGSKVNPYKFLAFNAGYRTCLGQNMAILEASIMLIKLLQKFDFKLVDDKIDETDGLLLKLNNLYIKI